MSSRDPVPIDPLDPVLDTLDPLDPTIPDPISAVLISQSMAAPVVPTTNPAVPDPIVPGTTSPASSAAATTSVSPTTQPTTSPAVTTSPSSSVLPSSSSVTSSAIVSSSSVITSSSTVSTAPSSAVVTTSSAVPSSASPTTTAPPSTQIVTVTRPQVSAPGLVTNVSASRSTASPSRPAAASNGKGGVGGSGLSIGALVGIVIGGLAVLALIGLLVTRSMRKRAREKRTANRSSMFEPWPAPVAMEDEPYEKPTYGGGPAQSYPMQEATNEIYDDAAYPAYGQAGYQQYNEYPPQPYGAYPAQPYSDDFASAGVAAAGAAGVGAAAGPSAASGLHDGMMVRVKVAFVRSLEDELAITPGQQLYLHTAYDDGWTLCEDQAQNRGVVPISCLEPWEETAAAATYPAQDGQHLNVGAAGHRRSSLHAPQ